MRNSHSPRETRGRLGTTRGECQQIKDREGSPLGIGRGAMRTRSGHSEEPGAGPATHTLYGHSSGTTPPDERANKGRSFPSGSVGPPFEHLYDAALIILADAHARAGPAEGRDRRQQRKP